MKKLFLLLMLTILTQPAAFSKALDKGKPAREGFIPERLLRIDNAINESIASGEIPGAVALIARNEKIVYHKPFGYADIASEKAMQNDAIFRIASMTKAITSVGVMILYEQGHFKLNDPIATYIPEFANPTVIEMDETGQITGNRAAAGPIKIVDLLTHSSGIGYPFFPGPMQTLYKEAGVIDGLTIKNVNLADKIPLLASMPLMFDPGTAFGYGLSTDVLGYLIEVVSGQPLDEFFEEHIFAPLSMNDTYFYLPEEKASRLATLYAHSPGSKLSVANGTESLIKLDSVDYPIEGARSYFSGGAGLSSTALDYARFIQMLLNDGSLDGQRVLGRKAVELMRTPRIDTDGDKQADFGLGFIVIEDLGKFGELGSLKSYSWGGAWYTSYWIDPAENLVAVFMTQLAPTQTSIQERFKTLVYQALE